MCRISGGGDRAPKGGPPPPVCIAIGPRKTEAMGRVALSGAPFGVITSLGFRILRVDDEDEGLEVATAADDMFVWVVGIYDG